MSRPSLAQKSKEIEAINLEERGANFFKKNEIDSAIHYFSRANSIIKQDTLIDVSLVHKVKNTLAIAFAYKQQNRKSIEIFKELMTFYQLINKEKTYDLLLAKISNNIAINYNLLFDYEQSLKYFDNSLILFQGKGASFDPQIRNLYLNKSLNYLDLSNYQSALENAELSQYLRVNNLKDINSDYEKMKENLVLSEIYIELKQKPEDLIKTKKLLKENITILNELPEKDQYLGFTLSLMGKTYFALENYDSAIFYTNSSIKYFTDLYGPNYTGLITKTNELGIVYTQMGKHNKAIEVFNKSISIPTSNEIDKKFYKGDSHLWKAINYLKLKEYKLVEKELTEAMDLVFPNNKNNSILINPNLDSLTQNAIFSKFFIKKGNILHQLYFHNNKIEYLKASLDAYISGINIGMKTRKGLIGLREKSLFDSSIFNNFDYAINIANEIFQLTNDIDDFWMVLWISDLSKSASLKDQINKKERILLGLPNSLISDELDLNSNILYYEQAVYKESFTKNLRQMDSEDENIKELQKAKEKLVSFKSKLKNEYPNYYSLMFGLSSLDNHKALKSRFLDPNFPKSSMIIDFYENKDSYIVSYIYDKKFGVYKIHKSKELRDNIQNLHSILKSKAKGNFAQSAHLLYKKLLSPILDHNSVKSIVLIPDGMLSYIPFDILLKDTNDSSSFKNSNYLINDYLISYQYAFSLIKTKQSPNVNSKSQVLALSPDFDKIRNQKNDTLDQQTRQGLTYLTNLPFAKIELNNISKLFKGHFLTGLDATEGNFKEKAPLADIIHLATHSLINENNPLTSKLFLNNDQTEDGLLHTFELFNLVLKADLVTLSACNTGYGELQRGEGVISLARGFMYANVQNILMSLWAVPDQSTEKLISSFYQNIHNGLDYNESLRNSKLEYLKNSDENTAHPYYWAGFVYLGDVEGNRNSIIYHFIYSLLLILFIYILHKRKLILNKNHRIR
jgi:CHAT domain-containing protein